MVPSRVAANFLFEVADWNQVGTSTSLGKNVIDLASLEPFESAELNVPVIHEKGAKGNLHLRLLFQPESESRPSRRAYPSHRAISPKDQHVLRCGPGHHPDWRATDGCGQRRHGRRRHRR
jgi:hypothetical protein